MMLRWIIAIMFGIMLSTSMYLDLMTTPGKYISIARLLVRSFF